MWLYRINRALGPLIGLYWRLALRGEVRSIPEDGPLLVAANHSSFLDPWWIGMAFPRLIRYVITDEWYYRNAAWNALFHAWGTVPVIAHDPGATIAAVCRCLERNDAVGMFPEGGVSRDGRIQRFHSGLARMAARSGAPVLPAGIRGGFESLPRHRRIPRPTSVEVRVGAPLVFPGAPQGRDPTPNEIREFNELLLEKISGLAGVESRR